MVDGEWRVLFVRVVALSVMAWGMALGYLLFDATPQTRIIAAVFVVVVGIGIVWAMRKLRR